MEPTFQERRNRDVQFVWNVPNVLTISRICMIPFLVYFLNLGKPLWALGLYFIAGITDLFDGWYARRYNKRTPAGAALDPLADKLTIMSIFGTLIYLGIIPWWLAAIVLARDVLILVGVYILRFSGRRIPFRSVPIGKVTTVVQNSTVLAALLNYYLNFPLLILQFLIAATVVLTAVSFVKYIQVWRDIYSNRKAADARPN